MALRSTQPLVKMITRDVPGGKGGRCVSLTTYHHRVSMSRNVGALTLLDPPKSPKCLPGLQFHLYINLHKFHLLYLEQLSRYVMTESGF
jgi:hypothetical protein